MLRLNSLGDLELQDFVDHPSWKRWCDVLRETKRSGYSQLGYHGDDVVNLYEHTTRVSRAALRLAEDEPELNRHAIHAMAMLHDFAEAITGDFMPGTHSAEFKHAMEKEAWTQRILPTLGDEARDLYDLWLRYERQECGESRLIWQVDKFEPLLEAIEFFDSHLEFSPLRDKVVAQVSRAVLERVSHPRLVALAKSLAPSQTTGSSQRPRGSDDLAMKSSAPPSI